MLQVVQRLYEGIFHHRSAVSTQGARIYYTQLIELAAPSIDGILGPGHVSKVLREHAGAIMEYAYEGPPTEQTKQHVIDLVKRRSLERLSNDMALWKRYLYPKVPVISQTGIPAQIKKIFTEVEKDHRGILELVLCFGKSIPDISKELNLSKEEARDLFRRARYKARAGLVLL
jgi:hypothetical protein